MSVVESRDLRKIVVVQILLCSHFPSHFPLLCSLLAVGVIDSLGFVKNRTQTKYQTIFKRCDSLDVILLYLYPLLSWYHLLVLHSHNKHMFLCISVHFIHKLLGHHSHATNKHTLFLILSYFVPFLP